MKLTSCIHHLVLLTCLVIISGPGYSAAETMEKQIPLPIGEMTDMLITWWEDAGYQIQRTEPELGTVRLKFKKGEEAWQVDLLPRSALATWVILSGSGMTSESRRQQFWNHVTQYVQNPLSEEPRNSDPNAPAAVLAKRESVVCINAQSNEDSVQFSGFIIDTNGTILCTAHDLVNNPRLTVTLFDGREVQGTLLFRDPHRDLSIIKIALKPNTAIHLSEGRNFLGMGETVFSVGCPVNLRGTVYAGTINTSPRKMNDQPLWQAHMEIYHGSSGSPVFDVNGNIVAMVKGRYRGTTTTAFLIPMETILFFFKEQQLL